jgi:RNA polymerase sigma-70 factor (ECF subfamily)
MVMPQPVAALEAPSDRALVERVVAGERALFEMLVRRHNQRLYRAARAITRHDQDAEDVLQQAWLNVFRNLAHFRGDASFVTWATRIAINEAMAVTRRRPAIVEAEDTPDLATPAGAVDRAELGKLLERCLATIPQGNREVLVLRDVLELDTAETAACLGVSEEAVRVRLHRARAAVAVAITEKLGDEATGVYGFLGARCDRITAAVMAAIGV